MASAGQQAIHFTDVMLTRGYSGARAYCQSKLAQIMLTIDLAGELHGAGVTVNALHPATYMDTAIVRRARITPSSSVEEGAEAILNLATSPALERRSGLYFNGLREARADGQAYDAKARQRLKAISLELTSLHYRGLCRIAEVITATKVRAEPGSAFCARSGVLDRLMVGKKQRVYDQLMSANYRKAQVH